jgi:hypothetical protein
MTAQQQFLPLLAALLVAMPALAAPTHTGTWAGSVKEPQLQLSLRPRGEQGSQTGMPVPLTAFQGLSTANGSTAPFRLTREAGTFSFEGSFSDGEGAGHFQFEPSESYAKAMAGLGYPKLSPDQHYQLALFDITSTRVKELAALGYKDIPLEELLQVGILQVTPEYVRALASLGYAKLSLEQLVQCRIHGVSPERIRALASEGYKDLGLETLLAMSIHGVTPAFIREIRAMGYPNVTADELITLRIHGIDPDFMRSLSGGKAAGDARKKQ